MQRICVFCGSATGLNPAYAAAAADLGRVLVARRIGLVYGGGHVGLMGVVADAVLAAGGDATGIIPRALAAREVAHRHLTRLHVVESMHERKALMADLSEAFIAMPGGFGTYEEFFEAVTWTQLGVHRKPCGLLNVEGFYDPMVAFLDRAAREGFIRPEHRAAVVVASEPGRLVDELRTIELPDVARWIGPAQA